MLDLDELEAKAKAAGPAWVKDGPWAETCVQPAEVLALIRELREARAAVAAEREAGADAESDAGRLALELECLLLSTDMPTVSRWWDSANEALDLHRSRLDSIRARGAKRGRVMESSRPKKVTVEIGRKEMLDFGSFFEFGVRKKCAEAGIPLDKYGTGTTEKGVLTWHDEPNGTRVIEWQPEEPARC